MGIRAKKFEIVIGSRNPALLGLAQSAIVAAPGDDPDLSRIRMSEIYFGARYPTPQDRSQQPSQGEAVYSFPAGSPRHGEYQLDGTWLRQGEALVLRSPRGRGTAIHGCW